MKTDTQSSMIDSLSLVALAMTALTTIYFLAGSLLS
jgi:hypothetical protein